VAHHYRAEVPGANGQGKSRAECLANLRGAITLILNIGAKNLSALPADARTALWSSVKLEKTLLLTKLT